MNVITSHPRALSGVWILVVVGLTLGAGIDWAAPSGWEEAAHHIQANGEASDLIVLTPSFEARQIDHFEGRMAVAADGVLPREVVPWDRLWLVSSGPIPPGISALLRSFHRGSEHIADDVTWILYTREGGPR
jgi:hypothetical protein